MQNRLNIALALIAGLAGGLLTRFVAPPTVAAQNQPQAVQEVRARSFVLVDAENRAVGTFSAEPISSQAVIVQPGNPPVVRIPRSTGRITLRDAQGREIWSAGPGARVMPLQALR
jgi:hypothetical protein